MSHSSVRCGRDWPIEEPECSLCNAKRCFTFRILRLIFNRWSSQTPSILLRVSMLGSEMFCGVARTSPGASTQSRAWSLVLFNRIRHRFSDFCDRFEWTLCIRASTVSISIYVSNNSSGHTNIWREKICCGQQSVPSSHVQADALLLLAELRPRNRSCRMPL